MALEELAAEADSKREHVHEHTKTRDKLIGVYVGILAVILAICSLGGSNAQQNSIQENIAASNVWSFFQAKNARRQALRLHTEEFDAMLKISPSMPEDAKKMLEAKIADYQAQDKKLTTDPNSGEGLDELFAKGKALEASRDQALQQGPYFDYGQALLQIAIVLASVALISGGNMLLYFSFALGALGSVLTFGGFTLLFPLPGFLS
jgi:hypothetical protein